MPSRVLQTRPTCDNMSGQCASLRAEFPTVPDVGSGEVSACPFHHRGEVRVWGSSGLSRITPRRVPTFRPSALKSTPNRTDSGARVPRGWRHYVRLNAKLRDMNIDVPATDERAIEVLASGLELNHGAQLAVDITVRSAVTACGRACPNAAAIDGAGFRRGPPSQKGGETRGVVRKRPMPARGRRHRHKREVAQRHFRSLNDWQSPVHATLLLCCGSLHFLLGESGGAGCCPSLAAAPSQGLWCLRRTTSWKALMALCLSWLTCFQLSSSLT